MCALRGGRWDRALGSLDPSTLSTDGKLRPILAPMVTETLDGLVSALEAEFAPGERNRRC